ncbi:putative C6 transcription factor [Aspergillus clavatus NRRL 1]|uniref:C6 transcription factor, putative n=1 Tax=Aspergillus clavatus (strain ATCC 1007 / CBS 513.65 / DSM 816 / NCTC 3887 / NRRL 1 / QM 1276 / 107) TaxID=344612 RepID=A1CAV1_ASPCL|nr:C6 transcription factor, putative [Aspergillus clavatus NRRL 1]EAW12869.1 C6 transcription factor, putative [Aspergillus clavatus NRRL 1]
MAEPQSRVLAPALPGVLGANESQQRRKNVGTACSVCKARKLKCSGTSPCTNCLKNNVECTLDATTDRRRRGALKRKLGQLEENEDLLVRLVSTLRESGNRHTIQLLNLIRSNASLPEIKRYIDTQLAGLESEKTPELIEVCNEMQRFEQTGPRSRRRRRILDAQHAVEPLFQVQAGPWTMVTADDAYVSHLISLWLTWVHPFYNWIDRGLFLRDMKSGSLESKFCSPFLVNVMLADASAYSDGPEALAQGARFYNEAKRLLDKEEGRYTLVTAQGIGVLWTCAFMNRKDRHGWIYQSQLAYAVRELSQSTTAPSPADKDALELSQVTNLTIWGLFNIAMTRAISDRKVPLIKPPRRLPMPPISHDLDADPWFPYPTESEKLQAHTSLYDLIKKSDKIGEPNSSNAPGSTQPFLKDLDEVRLSSARSISQLMRVYRSSWGVDRMPEGTSQWVNTALFSLLERLDTPENADAFINLSIAAKAASRRWSWSRAALDNIHSTATTMGVHIPTETEPLFADLEGRQDCSRTSSESPLFRVESVEATDGDGSES